MGTSAQAPLFVGLAHQNRLVNNERVHCAGPLGSRTGPASTFDTRLPPDPKLAIATHPTATTAMNAASMRLAPSSEVASSVHFGSEVVCPRHDGKQR